MREGSTIGSFGSIVAQPNAAPFPADFSEEDFRALQGKVRAILDDMVQQRTSNDHTTSQAAMTDIRATCTLMNADNILPRRGYHLLFVTGITHDIFLLTFLHLLAGPADMILRCPECATLFYRVRKQQYCSRACVNKATVRKWRGTPTGKAKENTRARDRYRVRVKQHTGANVVVGKSRRVRTKGATHAETPGQ
jgi:hypothetical protein